MLRPKYLSLLSVEVLFELRDDVAKVLSHKADALGKQLALIGEDYASCWPLRQRKGSLSGHRSGGR